MELKAVRPFNSWIFPIAPSLPLTGTIIPWRNWNYWGCQKWEWKGYTQQVDSYSLIKIIAYFPLLYFHSLSLQNWFLSSAISPQKIFDIWGNLDLTCTIHQDILDEKCVSILFFWSNLHPTQLDRLNRVIQIDFLFIPDSFLFLA